MAADGHYARLFRLQPERFQRGLDADGDWVELYNTTNQPIDLAGWYLSDDATDLKKYQFPANANSIIPANGYKVVTQAADFGVAGLPGADDGEFPLGSMPVVDGPVTTRPRSEQPALFYH